MTAAVPAKAHGTALPGLLFTDATTARTSAESFALGHLRFAHTDVKIHSRLEELISNAELFSSYHPKPQKPSNQKQSCG